MDLIQSLDHAYRHAHGVFAGVRDDQLGHPTPCAEWTVHDLMEHVTTTVAGLGDAAAGRPPRGRVGLAEDAAGQFQAVAEANLEAWRSPGALDRTVDVGAGAMPGRVLAGINLLDVVTHTWDLATATGQPAALPSDLAEAALAVSRQTIPEARPGRFGPEVPVPEGRRDDPTAQLVGFLGRQP